jgi:2-polyprenyl-3-methyl-5-hydroxy-6-metoxy-1,4-benzoquinol methylase
MSVTDQPPDLGTPLPALVSETQERFAVGEHFARAYLRYWQTSRLKSYAALSEILEAPDPYPMWFEFAMSTNGRGRDFAAFLEPHLEGLKGRYLDVGCGFGGCLRAFADQGFDVSGVEIDQDRIVLSKANARDGDLGDCVFEKNILVDQDPTKELGKFDLITCMDVIEHVLDVPLTLRRMSDMLNPGGMLALEIPNKDSLGFVNSDGHFNLFGITQLDRATSIRYHERLFQFDYDVGYYHPSDYYIDELAKNGLEATYLPYPLHAPHPLKHNPLLALNLFKGYASYMAGKSWKLPLSVNLKLHGAMTRFGLGYLRDNTKRHLKSMKAEDFQRKYLTNFWMLLARKKA